MPYVWMLAFTAIPIAALMLGPGVTRIVVPLGLALTVILGINGAVAQPSYPGSGAARALLFETLPMWGAIAALKVAAKRTNSRLWPALAAAGAGLIVVALIRVIMMGL